MEAPEVITSASLDHAKISVLGSPPLAVTIESPASVPVYIRNGTLISIYGTAIEKVQLSTSLLEPFKRTLLGVLSLRYQKLISIDVFSILIGSGGKSLASVVVDGSTDWAIFTRGGLLAYTGNSLRITSKYLPTYLSRKVLKQLGLPTLTKTGLFSWTKSGYTLISGRGQIIVSGFGSIYNVNVASGEELIIKKENLVGITINDDLASAVVGVINASPKTTEKRIVSTPALGYSNISQLKISPIQKTWKYVEVTVTKTKSFFSWFSFVKLPSFNDQSFVRIIGPRNLLIQSSVGNSRVRTVRKVAPVTANEVSAPAAPTSSDYLSYVTITPGKAPVIESTPDFRETVEKLEARTKK